MRRLTLLLLAFAAASPAAAVDHYRPLSIYGNGYRARGSFAQARHLILDRNLMTADQLRCAELIRGNKATGQVTQVRVLRKPAPDCPAVDSASAFLFDLYIDNASGSFQWTPDAREDQLEEVPYLGDAIRARLSE